MMQFTEITVDGTHIKSKRDAVITRAVEILRQKCQDLDLDDYRVRLSLVPKNSAVV